MLDALLTLPMVLPPTVVGYLLLLVFGNRRPVGALLARWGLPFVMTWYGGVLAAAVVAFPLMYRTARGAFEAFDETLDQAGQTLGLSGTFLFWRGADARLPPGDSGRGGAGLRPGAGRVRRHQYAHRLHAGAYRHDFHHVYQLWRTGDDAGALFWVGVNLAISVAVLLTVNLLERPAKGGRL